LINCLFIYKSLKFRIYIQLNFENINYNQSIWKYSNQFIKSNKKSKLIDEWLTIGLAHCRQSRINSIRKIGMRSIVKIR